MDTIGVPVSVLEAVSADLVKEALEATPQAIEVRRWRLHDVVHNWRVGVLRYLPSLLRLLHITAQVNVARCFTSCKRAQTLLIFLPCAVKTCRMPPNG